MFYTTRFGRRKKNNDLHSVEDLLATLKANNAGNKLMAVVEAPRRAQMSCLDLPSSYLALITPSLSKPFTTKQ